MSQADTGTGFTAGIDDLSNDDTAIVTTIVEQLDQELDTLDLYEGELTGKMYASVGTEYQCASVTTTGLQVTTVTTPDEGLEPLARIEPDEGETVEDAVDTLTFAGD